MFAGCFELAAGELCGFGVALGFAVFAFAEPRGGVTTWAFGSLDGGHCTGAPVLKSVHSFVRIFLRMIVVPGSPVKGLPGLGSPLTRAPAGGMYAGPPGGGCAPPAHGL